MNLNSIILAPCITSALSLVFALSLAVCTFSSSANAQGGLSAFDRDSANAMLSAAKDDIKKNYYDATLRGIDIDTRFKDAGLRLKQATTRDQLLITVAQMMLEFNDSHTFFLPPSRAARFEYGWEMQIVGDKAFVTSVKPASDAHVKGLKMGDLIISVDGYAPNRDNLWKMYYRYYALSPARSIKLVVQSPDDAQPRDVEVVAKIDRGAGVVNWSDVFIRILREHRDVEVDRYVEIGNDLMIWRMTSFSVSEDHVDTMMSKAQKFKSLILDLRGNGGGSVDTLARLAGTFFDHEVKIADMKGRKEMKPVIAKPHGTQFKGQLLVLIDSDSASASELFARAIQLEKRGTVMGDRSSGAVMAAKHYDHETGVGQVLYFGTSVTVADLIMADGKSLEKVGVSPDEVLIPSGADMAAQRDPVLAHAADSLGVKLDPVKAGGFFPKEWRP
jgi:C-terminal processing protease CtpA/Prc